MDPPAYNERPRRVNTSSGTLSLSQHSTKNALGNVYNAPLDAESNYVILKAHLKSLWRQKKVGRRQYIKSAKILQHSIYT